MDSGIPPGFSVQLVSPWATQFLSQESMGEPVPGKGGLQVNTVDPAGCGVSHLWSQHLGRQRRGHWWEFEVSLSYEMQLYLRKK